MQTLPVWKWGEWEGHCLLCGDQFSQKCAVIGLYRGRVPDGYLCPECAKSPEVARERCQARVDDLLDLVAQLSSVERWASERERKEIARLSPGFVYRAAGIIRP